MLAEKIDQQTQNLGQLTEDHEGQIAATGAPVLATPHAAVNVNGDIFGINVQGHGHIGG